MRALIHLIKAKNKKLLVGIGTACVALACLGLSIISVSTQKTAPEQRKPTAQINHVTKEAEQNDAFKEKINTTLSVIDKRLSLVQQEMEKAVNKNKVHAPNKALSDLSQTVVSFKEEAQRSLIQSHEENEALAKKIQALQDVIATLKGGEKKTQYLDKKALPFEILAIDSVNEEPVLALRYNYNHIALGKGDKLAGWKVINLDYAKQHVEFDDEKGAHVQLSFSDKAGEAQSWA